MIQRIIAGGQTGVVRAALNWAIANGIQQGGWCPAGRRAEDGVVADLYCLRETPQRDYRQRTKWNVRDSDTTLIITPAAELTGGSVFTQDGLRKSTVHACMFIPVVSGVNGSGFSSKQIRSQCWMWQDRLVQVRRELNILFMKCWMKC